LDPKKLLSFQIVITTDSYKYIYCWSGIPDQKCLTLIALVKEP
jgi:hypothetical protein